MHSRNKKDSALELLAILIVVSGLFSSGYLFIPDIATPNPSSPESVVPYEKRLRDLKGELPAKDIVGYLTDLTGREETGPYYLTQFVLAPVVVARGTDHEFVVGNFAKTTDPSIYATKNLVVVKDYGNGVILFARKPQE